MLAMTSLFGILEYERDPIDFKYFLVYVLTWLQDAGGFAAVGLFLWVLYVFTSRQANVVGSRRALISPFMAVTGLLALVSYSTALVIFMSIPAPPEGQQVQTPPSKGLYYALSSGGFFSVLSFFEPFFFDMFKSWRWRRIFAIAKLSFKEAVRSKIVWVLLIFLLVLMFPASWFFKQKPEDRLKVIVNVTYTAMTPLLVLTGLLLAAFSIPTDIKKMTIHTIVTKPVEPFEIAIGRFLGYLALMSIALFTMTGASLILIQTSNIEEAAKEESMKARSPVYGFMSFMKSGRPEAGIDVGREYTYRKYVPGAPNSPYRAEWRFDNLGSLSSQKDAVPCEFAFDVYRSLKGKENEGVQCVFEFRTWKWDPARQSDFDARTKELFKNDKWKEFRYPGEAQATPADKDTWEKLNKLSEEFGFYRVLNVEVEDYHTKSILLPLALLRNAASGNPTRDNTWLQMLNGSGPARLSVSVKCESPGQYIGVAGYDLYLLESEGNFSLNFFKGAIGLWCRLCIALALAITASTYLAGVVSFLVAVFLFLAGSFLQFIQSVTRGTNVGGGPLEAFTHLVKGETAAAQLDSSPITQLVLFTDNGFRWLLRRVYNVIPDTDRLTWSNYVAQGFNIPLPFLLLNLIFLAGYLLPWFVLAYYLMRSREVAA